MGNYQKGHLLQGGKYIVEQQIGRGGFGLTYLARNNETYLPTDRLQEIFPLMGSVVIKIPNENLQNNPKFGKYKQKFLEEAEKLKRFSHPNIVRFIDSFEEANLPHIVMEHIQGKSLKHWRLEEATSGNSATIIDVLQYIDQIGSALTEIHDKQLLHRDVKPDNIILRADGSGAVLIDFGVAREFAPNEVLELTAIYSSGYAPPEQYESAGRWGAYVDVYALAATLYFLLTKRSPEDSTIRALRVTQRRPDPLKPPKEVSPAISDPMNDAILRGMALDYQSRPQSIQEWIGLICQAIWLDPRLQNTCNLPYNPVEQNLITRNYNPQPIDEAQTGFVDQVKSNVSDSGIIQPQETRITDNLWRKVISNGQVNSIPTQIPLPEPLLRKVLAWAGSDLELAQKLCDLILNSTTDPDEQDSAWVDQLVQTHLIEDWETHPAAEPLRQMHQRLVQEHDGNPSLLELYQKVLRGEVIRDSSDPAKLQVLLESGLVVSYGADQFQVANRIYEAVFNQAWVSQELNKIQRSQVSLTTEADQRQSDNTPSLPTLIGSGLVVGIVIVLGIVFAFPKSQPVTPTASSKTPAFCAEIQGKMVNAQGSPEFRFKVIEEVRSRMSQHNKKIGLLCGSRVRSSFNKLLHQYAQNLINASEFESAIETLCEITNDYGDFATIRSILKRWSSPTMRWPANRAQSIQTKLDQLNAAQCPAMPS